jgi:hypothetical protein
MTALLGNLFKRSKSPRAASSIEANHSPTR